MINQSERVLFEEIDVIRREAIDFFRPKPSPFRLVRIGGRFDGAYLLPEELLPNITACFSAGCENRKSFEDELLSRFGITSYLLDYTSDADDFETPLEPGRQFFSKSWLRPDDSPDSMSLEDWLRKSQAANGAGHLLQMDIEEAEYSNLLASSRETLEEFSIMVVEFHGLAKRLRNEEFHDELRSLFAHLSQSFLVVHSRINNCCPPQKVGYSSGRFPQVLEVTFVRLDLFQRENRRVSKGPNFPHLADIARNVRHLPPQHLSSEWRVEGLRFSSLVKIALDWMLFFPHSGPRLYRWIKEVAYLIAPFGLRNFVARFRSGGK